MSKELKVLSAIAVVLIAGGIFLFLKGGAPGGNAPSRTSDNGRLLVRADSERIGNPAARVTVVEFADFQCPACAALHPTTKQIIANYQDQINFVFRHFPLPQHANAVIAAEAAEAAGEQGKFWEMQDKLFENQTQWSASPAPLDMLAGYAADLGLDVAKFKQAIEAQKFAAKIAGDQKDGEDLGVDSTPSFFINGQRTQGLPSYNEFKKAIDAELGK